MLKRRILASSMASVMALTSVVGVAFADEAEKNYVSAKTLKDYVKKMEDKKTDDYGSVSTATFEKALNYAETVVGNDEATDNDVAVAYLMLKEAYENLTTKSADDLNGLIKGYKKDYDTGNILNDDIGDQIWDPDTFDNFAYYYEEAESALDRDDPKEITDAWENLTDAHNKLENLTSVTKAQFHNMHNELAHLLEKEFDYNSWERVSVSGTGTVFDGITAAWSVLFYYVASADDAIMTKLDDFDKFKTVNKTTSEDIIDAYEACEEAVNVLKAATPAKSKNYSSEASVRNIILKDYKTKLLGNADFVATLLENALDVGSSGTNKDVAKYMYLDASGNTTVDAALNASTGIKATSGAMSLDKVVHNGQITIYVFEGDTIPTASLKVGDLSSALTKVRDEGAKYTAKINLVNNKDIMDFVQVLGILTGADTTGKEPAKIASKVWDGSEQKVDDKRPEFDTIVKDGDEVTAKLATFSALAGLKYTAETTNAFEGWLTETSGGPGGISGGKAAVMNSGDIATAKLAPAISDVLKALNGGTTYKGDAALATDQLAGSTTRKADEAVIITSKDVNLEKLGDKVSAKEWSIIGNYLNTAMSDWLDKAASKSYTVADADKLTRECDALLAEAGDSAVFAELCNNLSGTRADLVEEANANRRQGTKKTVDKDTYEECEDDKEALEDALAGFKYSYQTVANDIAKIAEELDNSDALKGNATVQADLEACVLAFIKAGNLTCKDSDEMENDVVDDSYAFAGYNRVYTAEGETEIGDITISKAKDGANRAHYELTQAYEKLLADHEEALKAPSADLVYDYDGDNYTDALDVKKMKEDLLNEVDIELKFDFDGDSEVTSLDAKELERLVLEQLV